MWEVSRLTVEVFGAALEIEGASLCADGEILWHVSARTWHLRISSLLCLHVHLLVVLATDTKGVLPALRHFPVRVEV